MRQRLGFRNPEYFEHLYKRKPKLWSISDLHKLWIKAEERDNKRWDNLRKYIQEIVNEITPNSKGEYLIYFMQNDFSRYYKISYNSTYRSFCWSLNDVNFKDRQDKLEYLTASEKAHEMGAEFVNLYRFANNRLSGRVYSILWDMVYDQLREHYKKIDEKPNKSFIISIDDKKYIILCEEQYHYMTFSMVGEYDNSILNIN